MAGTGAGSGQGQGQERGQQRKRDPNLGSPWRNTPASPQIELQGRTVLRGNVLGVGEGKKQPLLVSKDLGGLLYLNHPRVKTRTAGADDSLREKLCSLWGGGPRTHSPQGKGSQRKPKVRRCLGSPFPGECESGDGSICIHRSGDLHQHPREIHSVLPSSHRRHPRILRRVSRAAAWQRSRGLTPRRQKG